MNPEDTQRLLLVATTPETFATILQGQASALSAEFDVGLVASNGDEWSRIVEVDSVPFHTIEMPRKISPVADVLAVVRMTLLFRRLRPAVVQSFTPKAGLVAMLAGKLARVPVRVHTFTGLLFPSASGFRGLLLKWSDKIVCQLATRVVPEGEGVRLVLERERVTKKPLEVVGNGNIAGVDTAHFNPNDPLVRWEAKQLRGALDLSANEFLFCYVGRLNRDKGIDVLVRAFSQVTSPRARLLIIGAVDETNPPDQLDLARLKADDRILQVGFVDDVRPGIVASDVFVLPSYREGFSNSLLQASALARPVVSTATSGADEIVDHGVSGYVVPVGDAEALARRMQELSEMSEAGLRALGRSGRARVERCWERSRFQDALIGAYRADLERAGLRHSSREEEAIVGVRKS